MTAGSPGNPEYQLWLGQAYESKAAVLSERKSPMADVIPVHRQALRIFENLASATQTSRTTRDRLSMSSWTWRCATTS